MINWPIPSYVGERYEAPNGKIWEWNGYAWDFVGPGYAVGPTGPEGPSMYDYIEIQPSPEDIRILTSQYYELLSPPDPGKYIDIFRIITESFPGESPETSAYNYASYKTLNFSHNTSGFVSDNIASVYIAGGELWTGNNESYAISVPYSVYNLAINTGEKGLYVAIDDGDNPLNDATKGNHLVTFKIWYKIRDISVI